MTNIKKNIDFIDSRKASTTILKTVSVIFDMLNSQANVKLCVEKIEKTISCERNKT